MEETIRGWAGWEYLGQEARGGGRDAAGHRPPRPPSALPNPRHLPLDQTVTGVTRYVIESDAVDLVRTVNHKSPDATRSPMTSYRHRERQP